VCKCVCASLYVHEGVGGLVLHTSINMRAHVCVCV
jgi:hypothetical protein